MNDIGKIFFGIDKRQNFARGPTGGIGIHVEHRSRLLKSLVPICS